MSTAQRFVLAEIQEGSDDDVIVRDLLHRGRTVAKFSVRRHLGGQVKAIERAREWCRKLEARAGEPTAISVELVAGSHARQRAKAGA